jgi:hypothetical protein
LEDFMLSAAERLEKIARIESLPSILEAAVRGLTDSQLDTPYREGGWTVRQVVHHLADSHMNAFIRAKLIITENNPTLKPYSQDDWAATIDGRALPVQSSLLILKGLHERWVTLLRSLPDDAWSRTAQHPETGSVTLERQLIIYSGHGDRHVGQITGLRAAKGW